MKYKILLPCFLLLTIILSSCQKCKTCQVSTSPINGYDFSTLNDYATALGYADWNSYMATLYPAEEFCGDDLDEAEEVDLETDLDADGINDYRVFYNCL
jgi:hypothetical protein